MARKGHNSKFTFTDTTFTKICLQDIGKILLQLQDDEEILKVIDSYQELGSFDPYEQPQSDNLDDADAIVVEFGSKFDSWYLKRLLDKKVVWTSLTILI